ncbi:hypothetical protein SNOG_12130 [Parastagonospora nodorum SN15]|uniref:Aminoglycoside phosphotransferase domain-containing protein n=1 Tax=Phaeosphaeria nodorum (strain SN15 / ATCC MYA-4574 / FGSC 10173) TaxID=321614 RepID=Q0U7Y4_PHANO|nr:hypothetical protein SNOG_12130 [Parastagonospora nodorum SN15]EAT80542.1 hypothetical protein SNOG_12130 [Parastagonospora nodorum SN15]
MVHVGRASADQATRVRGRANQRPTTDGLLCLSVKSIILIPMDNNHPPAYAPYEQCPPPASASSPYEQYPSLTPAPPLRGRRTRNGYPIPITKPAARSASTTFPLDGATFDICSMPEEELISYGKVAPALHSLGRTKVVRLSKTLAMKFGPTVLASEGETMRYVATKLPGVRLPRVYRCFNVNQSSPRSGVQGYIVMDYIDSPSLDTCWDELSLRIQQSVVKQVAAMVDQLQSVHSDRPGVIGGGISHGKCFSIYGSGLFRTKEAFQKWIDRKLYLNTCNQVWLIDWECAGFYPPILEAASAKHQFQFESFSRLLLPLIYNNPEELAQFEGCSFGIHHVFNSLPPEMESESEQ